MWIDIGETLIVPVQGRVCRRAVGDVCFFFSGQKLVQFSSAPDLGLGDRCRLGKLYRAGATRMLLDQGFTGQGVLLLGTDFIF